MRFSAWHRTPIGGCRHLGEFDDADQAHYAGSRALADFGGAVQVFPLGRSRHVLGASELMPSDGTVLAPPVPTDDARSRRSLPPRERVEHGTVAELDYFGDEAAQ